MEKKKVIFKRNMGGEIRAYSVPEPPKTPPIVQTPLITMALQGAGDAVKSPYSDEIGIKQPLQMYDKGSEVGGTTIPEDIRNTMAGGTPARNIALQELYDNNPAVIEEAKRRAKEEYDKLLAAKKAKSSRLGIYKNVLRNDFGKDFDEKLWEDIVKLDDKQLARIGGDNALAVYRGIMQEQKETRQTMRNTYNYNKKVYESLQEREKLKGDMEFLYSSNNKERDIRLAVLNDLDPEELTDDERSELEKWDKDGEIVSDAFKDMYSRVAELDKSLNYRPKEGYNDDYLTTGYKMRRWSNNTIAEKNAVFTMIKSMGNPELVGSANTIDMVLGDAIDSFLTTAPNAKEALDALDSGEMEAFKYAAGELGMDILAIAGTLTAATGGKAAVSALKGALKFGKTVKSVSAIKAVLSKTRATYRALPKALRLGMESGTVVGGGKMAYNYATSDAGGLNFVLEEFNEGLASNEFHNEFKSKELIREVANLKPIGRSEAAWQGPGSLEDFYTSTGKSKEYYSSLYPEKSGELSDLSRELLGLDDISIYDQSGSKSVTITDGQDEAKAVLAEIEQREDDKPDEQPGGEVKKKLTEKAADKKGEPVNTTFNYKQSPEWKQMEATKARLAKETGNVTISESDPTDPEYLALIRAGEQAYTNFKKSKSGDDFYAYFRNTTKSNDK